MRGNNWELLLATARKKPHLQELVDRVDDLTEEDIRALPERPWIQKGLLQLKDLHKHGYHGARKAREVLNDFFAATPEQMEKWNEENNPAGTVYVLNVAMSVKLLSTRDIQSVNELPYREPLFQERNNTWHIGHLCGKVINQTEVMSNCSLVGNMTYREYRNFYREVENARQ